MTYQELIDTLDIFLNKETMEKTRERLAKFQEDSWLIAKIGERIIGKELRSLDAGSFDTAISLISNIVLADYPIDNPVFYQAFYKCAFDSSRIERCSQILGHLNSVALINADIPALGILKNDPQTNSGNPYIYGFFEGSYINFMWNVLAENSNVSSNMLGLEQRLSGFSSHINDLKNTGFNLGMLFDKRYAQVMQRMDANWNRRDNSGFEDISRKVSLLLTTFDQMGFNIYDSACVSKLGQFVEQKSVTSTTNFLKYASKEAAIYYLGLHLKEK
jgi:hypothetical protein